MSISYTLCNKSKETYLILSVAQSHLDNRGLWKVSMAYMETFIMTPKLSFLPSTPFSMPGETSPNSCRIQSKQLKQKLMLGAIRGSGPAEMSEDPIPLEIYSFKLAHGAAC